MTLQNAVAIAHVILELIPTRSRVAFRSETHGLLVITGPKQTRKPSRESE